jgi:hypothetical protein
MTIDAINVFLFIFICRISIKDISQKNEEVKIKIIYEKERYLTSLIFNLSIL